MISAEKSIRIIFTEKAEENFADIIKIYHLPESNEEAIQKIITGNLTNAVIVTKIIRAFAGDIITEKDFYWALEKVTHDKVVAQKLGEEIEKNLIPFLDKIPEDKLEEYNEQKEKEERDLIRSTTTRTPLPPPPPVPAPPAIKHPAIHNVEENAQALQESREEENSIGSVFEKAQKSRAEERGQSHINQDKYRESI